MYEAWFDEFVIFMSKLSGPIDVLRIKYHTSSDYLDANDWEHLIKLRLPYLRTFDYEYHVWIKHQWFF